MKLSTQGTLVEVSEDCTMHKAKELRNSLIALVDMLPKMELDLSKVTEVDYCFLQIIHMLHMLMVKNGKHLQVLSLSKSIQELIIKTGFCHKYTCDLIERKCQIHELAYK